MPKIRQTIISKDGNSTEHHTKSVGTRDGNSSENFTPRGIEEWQNTIPRGSRKVKSIPRGIEEFRGMKMKI